MPDYDLERGRISLEIAQLELNIQSSEYRKMQLASEMQQIDVNIEATRDAVADRNTQLKGITGHGR